MNDTLIVHFFLFFFSIAASIIQGITGFGDAILLQVVWYTATVISPTVFNTTALGDSSVRAVTLLMYCRIVFSAPLLAYMSFHDGVFSLQMTLAMAVPSTLTALAGIFIFKGATSEQLKLVLGISGLVFAALYGATLATKYILRRRKLRRLGGATEATAVTIVPEIEAVEADLNASRNSFARESVAYAADRTGGQQQPDNATTPALVSISTGSPSNTLSYTRVRVNRNLDENGKIKLSTKIGAAIAALFSGIMGSLTGVGGTPQIIFVLLFDVPQYIMRVNFAMQSIPSAALRFIYACSTDLFTRGMIPLFVTSVISGYIGIFLGVKLGKMLGPKSYSIFVLVLLLLSSLVMITESVAVLVSFTVITILIAVGAAAYEHRQTAAKVKLQVEMELEERRRGEAPAILDSGAGGTVVSAPSSPSRTDVTPPSPSLPGETMEMARSRAAHNTALADTASVLMVVSVPAIGGAVGAAGTAAAPRPNAVYEKRGMNAGEVMLCMALQEEEITAPLSPDSKQTQKPEV